MITLIKCTLRRRVVDKPPNRFIFRFPFNLAMADAALSVQSDILKYEVFAQTDTTGMCSKQTNSITTLMISFEGFARIVAHQWLNGTGVCQSSHLSSPRQR